MVKKIFFPLEVFYPSQAGGPANTVYWITKNLAKNGFEPVIVSTDKGLQPEITLNKWLETGAGKTIYVKTRFLHFPLYQILISLSNFYRSDIIHISSVFFPTAFITAFAARILGKNLVWSPRGELDPHALNHSNLRKRPILWCIKKFIGKYPVFHATCNEETEYIKSIFGSDAKTFQIPNYIEVPAEVERKSKDYLLYIGRIHPKKAIDNLIKACAISEAFLKSKYVLKIAGIGKKEFESDLRKLVEKLELSGKVVFAGQVEGAEKQKLLADAFWTIMPSHTENFGIVVLESLAQSTPVIASKGSPWASLENEKIGFWSENSPEMLAETLKVILEMPSTEYEGYRQRSRGFVEREFDIAENIDKWIELYKSLK
ncbi:MAG TPA: glycosyltransferase [Pyrinomonadaceae bacterium]|nr:glycosyltransferase [Pyrinomonadaceae bacterium]